MIESASEKLSHNPVVSADEIVSANDDIGLRPLRLSDYIGQSAIKKNLDIAIKAAKKRGEVMDHVLLHGSPGLGKTTLANIIANELAVNIVVTSGPAIEKSGDLASILSNLSENDVLFIDEIHRLKPVVEEVLYGAMEDFCIDLVVGKGPAARTMRINVPKFTLIGATTKLSSLSSPLRSRFGSLFKLSFYTNEEIASIVLRSAGILGCELDGAVAAELAKCCRKTPRIANRLLKRLRDYADVHNDSVIDASVLLKCLENLGIDSLGLDDGDRQLLRLLIEKFNGGPVGLNTLSAALHEESATIEDIYEPFLIQLGFLDRTPRGRIVTMKGYRHLNLAHLR